MSSKAGNGSLNEHGSNVSLVQTLIFIDLFLPSDANEHLRRSSSSLSICLLSRIRKQNITYKSFLILLNVPTRKYYGNILYPITVICLNLRIVFFNCSFRSLSWYQIAPIFFHYCWMKNNNLDQRHFCRLWGNIILYCFRNWSSEMMSKYFSGL